MQIQDNRIDIIQGDTKPSFTVTLKRNDEPIDLTGRTVNMIVSNSAGIIINRTVSLYDAKKGMVLVQFVAGETDPIGNYVMFFRIDDGPETAPVTKDLKFNIVGI